MFIERLISLRNSIVHLYPDNQAPIQYVSQFVDILMELIDYFERNKYFKRMIYAEEINSKFRRNLKNIELRGEIDRAIDILSEGDIGPFLSDETRLDSI